MDNNYQASFMDNLAAIFLDFLRKQAGIVIVLVAVVVGLLWLITWMKKDNDRQHDVLRKEMHEVRTELRQCHSDKEELRVRLGKAELRIEILINRRK